MNTDQASPARGRSRRVRLVTVPIAVLLLGSTWLVNALHAQAAAPPTPSGWSQTFLDDFTGTALSGAWRHSEGTSYPGGPANFGTGEVQTNSRDNVSVAGGIMSITAQGNGLSGWTSDRIETNRQDFQPPTGGKLRVEARLRLPEAANGQSSGYWPAFWMLAGAYRGNWWNWPTVGEIDIMESVSGLNRTWQTMHCGWLDPAQGPNVCNEKDGVGNGGAAGACGQGTQSCTKAFHTYTVDWSDADKSVTWYVDGRQVWRTQRGVNIRADAWDLGFQHGFFIVLNLSIGGEMPANNGVPLTSATTGGGHYDADYVAVYTGGATAPPPGGTSPTASPTSSRTASPTAGPTPSRTISPTPSRTASPTSSPTSSPITGRDAYSTIQAESANQVQGTTVAGTYVGPGGNGDYLRFDGVNFGPTPATQFKAQAGCGAAGGVSGLVEVRVDSPTGPVLGSFAIADTGGWTTFRNIPANMSAVTGTHTVYVTLTSGQPADFVTIDWITFGH
jgi:hypothetical protein